MLLLELVLALYNITLTFSQGKSHMG